MWFTYCDPQIKLLVWMSLSQRILFSIYYEFEDITCEIWTFFMGYFFPTFVVSEKMHHSHQTSIDGKLIICSIKANETNFLEVLHKFLTKKKISVEMHKMCVINWMKKISSKITKLQLFCFRNAIMYMILISKKGH